MPILAKGRICALARVNIVDSLHSRAPLPQDGFSLMYAEETYERALAAVAQIARRFDQGAIFDYAWGDGVDALRTTVPVTCNGEAHGVVRMRRVARVPVDASPMLRRPWAGPAVLQPNDD